MEDFNDSDGPQRMLEPSDFKTKYETAIKNDPYSFFGLPKDAPIEDVRRRYKHLAMMYFPDVLGAKLGIYSPDYNPSKDPTSYEDLMSQWNSIKKELDNIKSTGKVDNREEEIMRKAHQALVIINRAYEEIKSRYDPKKWNQLCGYDLERVFNSQESNYVNRVTLEGRGELTIYTYPYNYWAAGTWLMFDYGPNELEMLYGSDYQNGVNLKHFFAHVERSKGQEVSRILLEPLFDCFSLTKEQSNELLRLVSSRQSTVASTIETLNIPSIRPVEYKKDHDGWLRLLQFRRQIEDVLSPRIFDEQYHKMTNPFTFNNNGTLTLRGHDETVFSEPDVILFLTLAYGPLLNEEDTSMYLPEK